jgi:F-type H+-transporting ATPase subunit g
MLVYLKEKMSPPSGAEFRSTYEALWKQLSNPNRLISRTMEYMNITKAAEVGWQPFARVGLRGIELFGFFCIGEMVGRRSIKGYKL